MNLIDKATAFAAEMHYGQLRKFTNEPYIEHPRQTAEFLYQMDSKASKEDYAAALLHDVIEDTEIPSEVMRESFGDYITDLVLELTIDEEEKKEKGKKAYLAEKLNEMSEKAFNIKIADRLSNVIGLLDVRVEKDFVKWYLKETDYMLEKLTRELSNEQYEAVQRLVGAVRLVRMNRLYG
jgi:(p)ppGpp synthase/HD superfamily hydrolase